MMQEEFDFELDRVASTIRDRGCRKVLLQFPEGLKRRAPGVASVLSEKTGATIIISGEPCFGACDIPDTDADLTVHFGHLPIPSVKTRNSVLFIQARSDADPYPALKNALPRLGNAVGLLTTAQHLHHLNGMAEFLRSKGLRVQVGQGDSRLYMGGQVLGCNASSARAVADDVDSFLFVGTGDFHAIAIALTTSKQVLIADPATSAVKDAAELRDGMLRQRHAAIEKARQARSIGIILSTKLGQRREKAAIYSNRMLADAGYETALIEFELVTPQKLESFGLDAWVSTACPRLAIDDFAAFPKPVLTVPEAEILTGKRAWNDYVFDEIP
jgi:2-(3-amino-3-carboxypropyl)histidine synthase